MRLSYNDLKFRQRKEPIDSELTFSETDKGLIGTLKVTHN